MRPLLTLTTPIASMEDPALVEVMVKADRGLIRCMRCFNARLGLVGDFRHFR